MCGRYAVRRDPAALAAEFDAEDRTEGQLGPDYNVTPTRTVPIVVERLVDGDVCRSVRPVRWGLVPTWAKEPDSGPPMINARAESITTKPAFADAVARRRCLVPATGWYEWQPGDGRRQPFLCGRRDGTSMALAGVFSAWFSPEEPHRPPLVTCAVVTADAVGELAEVHHRMPVVLPRRAWSRWLAPGSTEVDEWLRTPGAEVLDELELYPVSTEVNAMRNNHPDLLRRAEPLPAPPEQEALFES